MQRAEGQGEGLLGQGWEAGSRGGRRRRGAPGGSHRGFWARSRDGDGGCRSLPARARGLADTHSAGPGAQAPGSGKGARPGLGGGGGGASAEGGGGGEEPLAVARAATASGEPAGDGECVRARARTARPPRPPQAPSAPPRPAPPAAPPAGRLSPVPAPSRASLPPPRTCPCLSSDPRGCSVPPSPQAWPCSEHLLPERQPPATCPSHKWWWNDFEREFWELCNKCNLMRPKRSHHCSRCGHCVRRMDHHCPWINNCVGEDNHWLFLQLCFYTELLTSYALMFSFCHYYYFLPLKKRNLDLFLVRHELAIMRLAAFMGITMLVGITGLFYTQLIGIITDTTSIEKMSNCCEEISRPRKPWQQTFSEVFGTRWKILWFIPFRQRQPLRVPYHFANHV
ncbi:PREDICTED: palmitoyltransferase ZDHHC21 [Propithecus coquereli]|uniref:palmitoyltransferase ZDHHC21 n=1 Tax=Propithecus coquereli TaxID=379532 RepID=UPI00063F98AB|nr:PREDICTED: palmitoyltransferase ZDHHC21 [Propithecus coquereli]